MKVITASTSEQQEYALSLMKEIYDRILPEYFSEGYIAKLKSFQLMDIPSLQELSLAEIFEVTTALQTITSILDTHLQQGTGIGEYEDTFQKNIRILGSYHINFPFTLRDFLG
ncbi:DUF5365 family protein [Sediminibacillus halophilus]|uniref:Uncharacterized protein n=1 Tax=Sediminibacillus halophilus TaxID=482461 RepID=A0A1G9M2N2_9BACI|nr:DUF5365 family protein [Sediminibacillus halophilus]SDL68532.1 hypothetical protein SAMN05216244_0395 [Sediminibacillus halophilus]